MKFFHLCKTHKLQKLELVGWPSFKSLPRESWMVCGLMFFVSWGPRVEWMGEGLPTSSLWSAMFWRYTCTGYFPKSPNLLYGSVFLKSSLWFCNLREGYANLISNERKCILGSLGDLTNDLVQRGRSSLVFGHSIKPVVIPWGSHVSLCWKEVSQSSELPEASASKTAKWKLWYFTELRTKSAFFFLYRNILCATCLGSQEELVLWLAWLAAPPC